MEITEKKEGENNKGSTIQAVVDSSLTISDKEAEDRERQARDLKAGLHPLKLSSKCDNRLFRIRFDIPKIGTYPFLEAFSLPIRCISRNRNTRTSSLMLKKLSSTVHPLNGSQSSGLEDGFSEFQQNVCESKFTPPSKRVKLGQEKLFLTSKADPTLDQPDEECYSHARTNSQVWRGDQKTLRKQTTPHQTQRVLKQEIRFSRVSSSGNQILDLTTFKYCLGGLTERALLLKELAMSSSDKELAEFADGYIIEPIRCGDPLLQFVMTEKSSLQSL